jgi:hypothetical protein
MSADDAVLFIDANKYLDLYRTVSGKKLLPLLAEQAEHIFVTRQVVSEVQRNKLAEVARFVTSQYKQLKLQTFKVVDHLSGTAPGEADAITKQMRGIGDQVNALNEAVDALALGIVERVSRSEDEVSLALAPIFAKAVDPSAEELQRARNRREVGDPPGKRESALGDQLNWEQILTRFRGRRRLWVISRDGDYGTTFAGKGFLNRFLMDDLCRLAKDPEAYLFEDTAGGIQHFVETTGVKADRRLTPEETKEVEKEEKALPPLGWMSGTSGAGDAAMIAAWNRRREEQYHAARVASGEMGFDPSIYQQRRGMSPALLDWIIKQATQPGSPPFDPNQTRGE